MSKDEYLEFITHQPYDAMGDFSFLLDEKSDKAENSTVDESSEPGKKHRSMKQNFIRHTKKKIKNVQSRRQSWQLVKKKQQRNRRKKRINIKRRRNQQCHLL